MKSFICVKKVNKKIIDNLNVFDYVIIYFDNTTKKLKITIPDYNEEYTDNKSLYEATNGRFAFFKKVNNLASDNTVIGIFTNKDEITDVVGYCDRNSLINSLDVNAKVLRKRLK